MNVFVFLFDDSTMVSRQGFQARQSIEQIILVKSMRRIYWKRLPMYDGFFLILRLNILNYKRHYNDSWLYLPISPLILSFPIQTAAIGNDIVTVIGASIGFDFSCSTYFETFQRFFEIFKRDENETSVQARDQQEIN